MKHLITIFILILIFVRQIFAQDVDTIPSYRKKQINKIVELIKNDEIQQLSGLIQYPLKRPNPVPDINNKDAFILYYNVLFDSDFKKKLVTANYATNNTIDRSDGFGLFNGDIWINENGLIITINYNSKQELALIETLENEIKRMINPGVTQWKKNILVCKSNKFLIRVDLMEDNSLRYVSWGSNKKISDTPDLILYKGLQEFHGTMGGVTYTFKNGDWTYTIDDVRICESADKCGLFLKLLNRDVEKSVTRLEEIK